MIELSSGLLIAWNTGLTVILFLVSVIAKSYGTQFQEAKKDIEDSKARLGKIELLVAGEYVTRTEFKQEIRDLNQMIRELGIDLTAKLDERNRRYDSREKGST